MSLLDSIGSFFSSLGSDTGLSGLATQTGWGQVASTGLQIGSDIYQNIEGNKVAAKHNAALMNEYYIEKAQLDKRATQVTQAANQQASWAEMGANTEIARAEAIAGEYGGGGNSAGRLAYAANYRGDQNINSIRTNQLNTLDQINMQGYGARAQAQAGQEVGMPWLATAFQIGGSIANYAGKYFTATTNNPKGTLTNNGSPGGGQLLDIIGQAGNAFDGAPGLAGN